MAAMTPQQMALILSKAAGKEIAEEQIKQDIADGAPVDADGNLNMLSYAAWLARAAQASGH